MKIIVITGVSSGLGALTARALAKAGHTVYASMRDTAGQNSGLGGPGETEAADSWARGRTTGKPGSY